MWSASRRVLFLTVFIDLLGFGIVVGCHPWGDCKGGYASNVSVHGLAHITGGGLLNLLRLSGAVGFAVEEPLPVPPIVELVRERGGVSDPEAWEVFNMGCGFVAAVPPASAEEAAAVLGAHHPGARRIGTVTDAAGRVAVPAHGVAGDANGLRAA